MKPARFAANATRLALSNPFNPMTHTAAGRHTSAVCEVFERTTRRYDKPVFGIETTRVGDVDVAVTENVVWQKPFCRMIHFRRDAENDAALDLPKVLLFAPMSGHYATLLRGTVETLLPTHDVYITDWQDARDVPVSAGAFNLDDYIDYARQMIRCFRGDVHVFAVCQPSVPVLAAAALMEADEEPYIPRSITLAGGPVDTRVSPTAVNHLAEEKGTRWFRDNVISVVPWSNPGAGRAVYPGFLQLTGFMTMNLDRHMNAHADLFRHLVDGDGDSAEKHRTFYDEYLAVMDLTAEFYLQTIDSVFVRHSLPRGTLMHRGRHVDLSAIKRIALMTIEGEKDDITGLGQCRAALELTPNLSDAKKLHYTCPKVGHYGVFNGSRFRNDIAPRIAQFMMTHDPRAASLTASRPTGVTATTDAQHQNETTSHEAHAFSFSQSPTKAVSTSPLPRAHGSGGVSMTHAGPSMDPTADVQSPDTTVRTSSATAAPPSRPKTAPFQMWSLAGHMMANGLFGPTRRD